VWVSVTREAGLLRSGFEGAKKNPRSLQTLLEFLPSRLGARQRVAQFQGIDPQLLSLLGERQLKAPLPEGFDFHATREGFTRGEIMSRRSPRNDFGGR